MNALDLFCAVLLVSSIVAGWRFGFVRRVVGWLGMAVGVLAASWLLPRVLDATDPTSSPSRFLVGAAVLLAGAAVGQALGAPIGARLHRAVGAAKLGPADAVLGSFVAVLGLVVGLWILLPTMADVPGWPARQARTSAVARTIDRTLGSPPAVLDGLSQALGLEGLPRVFADLGTAPDDVAPPTELALGPEVLARAEASTVKVVGPACDRLQTGSGFVVGERLVLTNAHVVAGTESLRVETSTGTRAQAELVAFDPLHDLALLRVPALGAAPLPLSDAAAGDVGAALGYPRGGPLTVAPYRVASVIEADGRDIYDRERVRRRILIVGADLAPGDSGGPLVDPTGAVAGVSFAIAPDRPGVAYAIANDQVRELLSQPRDGRVSSGPCTR